MIIVCQNTQRADFPILIHELTHKKPISSRPLARLCPYIDERGVIRVGGRLQNSQLLNAQKHPILLHKSSHMSTLVARHWHEVTGHAGSKLMTSMITRRFWILALRVVLRRTMTTCTTYVRHAAVNPQPVMANLPSARVSQCRPFDKVGIDYASPLTMRELWLRKSREYKVYIAVFVCFTIKAVHLELVSDLTSDVFLVAFNQFVACRGLPSEIFSDCGTNFVGADKTVIDFRRKYQANGISIPQGRHTSEDSGKLFDPPKDC